MRANCPELKAGKTKAGNLRPEIQSSGAPIDKKLPVMAAAQIGSDMTGSL